MSSTSIGAIDPLAVPFWLNEVDLLMLVLTNADHLVELAVHGAGLVSGQYHPSKPELISHGESGGGYSLLSE